MAEPALEDARFKADQARARFEAVDPRNRSVIGNLSRSWEECLEVVREREGELLRFLGGRRRQQGLL